MCGRWRKRHWRRSPPALPADRLVTNILAVLSAIAEAMAGLARFLVNRQLIKAGRDAERADRTEDALEIKDAQLEAARDAPRGRDSIVERLRRGGL